MIGTFICFVTGMFMRTWLQSLGIGAAMAVADLVLFQGPKVRDHEIAYMAGYLGGVFVFDVVATLIGHGLRRLFLKYGNS